jgi:glycosyltransferase involved in cell wall biosynthesis
MKIVVVHPGASMSTSDVWSGLTAALRDRGHDLYDYALDARIERSGAWLNYCWAKGGKKLDKPGPPDILYHAGEELVARTLRVMPDVVLVVSGMYLHPDALVLLKRAGIKTAVLFTESPYDDERQVRLLPHVDIAWTNERLSAVGKMRYLPHAFNREVHQANVAVPYGVKHHGVLFIGTCFQERIDLLSKVDWDGIDLALYGNWADHLGSRHRLRKYIRGEYVDNTVAAALYRKADIGLNLYRTSKGFGKDAPRITRAESLNPRAYELAATGCFTVSNHRAEVAEVFGDLVPMFERPEELRPLLEKWLKDDRGRARAREALPNAVAGHTWHDRAAQLESDLQGAGIGASHAVQLSGVGRQASALAGG